MRRYFIGLFFFISACANASTFEEDIVAAAYERTRHSVTYNGRYIGIAYPGGDVPQNIGVCSDVIIRSYRALGEDLQRLVHEDMASSFSSYPSKRIWGLNKPDSNIDHRRVQNLRVFFTKHGVKLKASNEAKDYNAGDLVTWMLPGNLPHIGIVTDTINPASGNPMVVHNIGRGPRLDDMLFNFEITGHYKYVPEKYILN